MPSIYSHSTVLKQKHNSFDRRGKYVCALCIWITYETPTEMDMCVLSIWNKHLDTATALYADTLTHARVHITYIPIGNVQWTSGLVSKPTQCNAMQFDVHPDWKISVSIEEGKSWRRTQLYRIGMYWYRIIRLYFPCVVYRTFAALIHTDA